MRGTMILAAVLGATLPLCAVDGTLLAQSGDSPEFDVYSADGATYAAMSASEIAGLMPVTWKAGETVTVTSPGGVETELTSPSLASVLNAGGVWTLANSVQGTARIGVAWSVYGDGGTLASGGMAGAYGVDSVQPGPDRRTKMLDILPVAYSGDSWAGDMSQASSLTFTAPDGTATALNLSGTGTTYFRMASGLWTVCLQMADGATHTAELKVVPEVFTINFR